MAEKIVYCDVDGTVALTHEVWYARYNRDYQDNLTGERVTDWGTHAFTKPECGKKIYEYLDDPDLYEEVVPLDGSMEGVETLRKYGFRIVFLTSGVHKGKISFLRRYGFIEKTGDKDFIIAHDKSLVDGSNSLLIDDGYHNIQAFKGIGILLDAPHNRKYHHTYRAMDWDDVVAFVFGLEGAKRMASYMSYGKGE
jgi:5'-nucleotidase